MGNAFPYPRRGHTDDDFISVSSSFAHDFPEAATDSARKRNCASPVEALKETAHTKRRQFMKRILFIGLFVLVPVTVSAQVFGPDLVIDKVEIRPSTAAKGDTLKITVTVKNKGNLPAPNFNYRLTVPPDTTFVSARASDPLISCSLGSGGRVTCQSASPPPPPLPPGATTTVTIEGKVNKAGFTTQQMNAKADAMELVTETNENNNLGSGQVRIIIRPVLTLKCTCPSATTKNTAQTVNCTITNSQDTEAKGVVAHWSGGSGGRYAFTAMSPTFSGIVLNETTQVAADAYASIGTIAKGGTASVSLTVVGKDVMGFNFELTALATNMSGSLNTYQKCQLFFN